MAWATLDHSIEKVNAAGKKLPVTSHIMSGWNELEWRDYYNSLDIINNWRSCHSYPLHIHYKRLRYYTKIVDQRGFVARRLKRLSSIEAKLIRFPNMKLSQMQDIGGCRAVVASVRKVRALVKQFKESSKKHELVHEDDYIKNPQVSGYRGIHLVYRYNSDKKTKIYNGRKAEVQLRSTLQHIWATAVEVYGMITNQMLKSSRGREDWLRFFALMSAVVANHERSPAVPNTPLDKAKLKKELAHYAKSLDVLNILDAYTDAIQTSLENAQDADLFLIQLDSKTQKVSVIGYQEDEASDAVKDYLAAETLLKESPGSEVVLVAVESLSSLRRAYPNYFLDTKGFIKLVREALA
jgi:ppGpp synthetase/RelA/SpoT-type nucleotidyltranferase